MSIMMKIAGCRYHYQHAHLLLKSVTIVKTLLLQFYNNNDNSNDSNNHNELKQCIELCKQHTKDIIMILIRLGESSSSSVIQNVIEIDTWLNK